MKLNFLLVTLVSCSRFFKFRLEVNEDSLPDMQDVESLDLPEWMQPFIGDISTCPHSGPCLLCGCEYYIRALFGKTQKVRNGRKDVNPVSYGTGNNGLCGEGQLALVIKGDRVNAVRNVFGILNQSNILLSAPIKKLDDNTVYSCFEDENINSGRFVIQFADSNEQKIVDFNLPDDCRNVSIQLD